MPLNTQRLNYLQQKAAQAEQIAQSAPQETYVHLTKMARIWRAIADDYADFFKIMQGKSKP